MKSPILQGERVTLRPIEDGDKPVVANGQRDLEFLRLVGDDTSTAKRLTDAQFEDLKRNPLHWAIALEDACIGTLLIHSVNQRDNRASYVIGIVSPARWGHGLGEEATRLAIRCAFDVLGLHRLGIRVLSYNARAIRCYEKCGFTIEGEERESALVGGTWCDDTIVGVLASDYAGWSLRHAHLRSVPFAARCRPVSAHKHG